MGPSLRHRVHRLLRTGEGAPALARWINGFIVVLILLNVVAVLLETVASVAARYGGMLHAFEVLSVAVFTVEYLARLWTAPEDPDHPGAVRGRLGWAITPLALIDLAAVLPFYLPLAVALDLRVLRVLRLLRILRVLKLARYNTAMQTMGRVFRRQRHELLITVFTVAILIVLASTMMYWVEHEAQPEAFASIPHAIWWAVVTLTTVGYGDVVPVTTAGRLLAAVIAVLGIGMIALPAGILGSGFVEEIQSERDEELPTICPHCGRDVRTEPEDFELMLDVDGTE